MHKLIDFICDELDDLEEKAEHGKLSMAEVEYGDMLAHFKKNLLTADAMMEADDYSYDDGMSMARDRRNARRDMRGRYSRTDYGRRYSREEGKDMLMDGLRDLEMDAKDEQTRQMIANWMHQLEKQ